MCGILGQWNRDGSPIDLEALAEGSQLLRHRGPDDEGFLLANSGTRHITLCKGDDTVGQSFKLPSIRGISGHYDIALLHRRLSIVDLSSAGHQPMVSGCGKVGMIYNGEIYNHASLRRELQSCGYTFRSSSDSEVLLNSYVEWGDECFRRLNGMWAVVFLDMRGSNVKLCLSRDRFGIKPLHRLVGTQYIFGSEIKAIKSLHRGLLTLDLENAAQFLCLGSCPLADGGGFFNEVEQFPPASWGAVEKDSDHTHNYWNLDHRELNKIEDPIHSVLCSLRDSVGLRLQADVEVGSCLSGGLDSSAIVALATDRLSGGAEFNTFSAVYDELGAYNERQYVDTLTEALGTRAHMVVPGIGDFCQSLSKLVWHQEEPFPTTSVFAQWCVMKQAKAAGVKVLLDGQAADELFGGYAPYYLYLVSLLKGGEYDLLHQELRRARAVAGKGVVRLLTERIKGFGKHLVATSGLKPWGPYRLLTKGFTESLDWGLMNSRLEDRYRINYKAKDLNHQLADMVRTAHLSRLLHYEDRNSMAHSIEARVPFTDYRLVELAFHPELSRSKIRDGWTKWVLRKAMEDMLPKEIVWRRDKVAFATPESKMVLAAWHECGHQLTSGEGTTSELVNLRELNEITAKAQRGEMKDILFLWRILCFDQWSRLFLD